MPENIRFKEDGIARYPSFIKAFPLITELLNRAEIRETEESSVPHEALKQIPEVREFVDSTQVLQLFPEGKRISYHAHRLYPYRVNGYGAYRWHFDGRPGWPIKAMILLSDVDADGQRMEFVKGSGKARDFLNYEESRFGEGEPEGERILLTGKTGDLWLFDAWAWHRGVRKDAPIRDTFTVEWVKSL